MEQERKENMEEQKPNQDTKENLAKSSIWFKTTIILFILIIMAALGLGAYFLGTKNASNTQNLLTPTPTITTEANSSNPSPTVKPTVTAETQSFSSTKFSGLSFNGYSLKYPADWTLSEQRDDSVPMSTVTLTKQGYVLKIFQGATGGAQCIYQGDMPEGPASDYRTNKYTDLVTSFGTLRQTESPSNGKMVYVYCQKNTSDGSFGQPTSVGHMNVTTGVGVADPKIISEFEEIVKSIKVL